MRPRRRPDAHHGHHVDKLRDGWHHLVLTKAGPNLAFYLDGVRSPRAPAAPARGVGRAVARHEQRDVRRPVRGGRADEVAIYDRALARPRSRRITGSGGRCLIGGSRSAAARAGARARGAGRADLTVSGVSVVARRASAPRDRHGPQRRHATRARRGSVPRLPGHASSPRAWSVARARAAPPAGRCRLPERAAVRRLRRRRRATSQPAPTPPALRIGAGRPLTESAPRRALRVLASLARRALRLPSRRRRGRPCTSPVTYTGLAEGDHRFSVTASRGARRLSATTVHRWTIDTTAPPAPTRLERARTR